MTLPVDWVKFLASLPKYPVLGVGEEDTGGIITFIFEAKSSDPRGTAQNLAFCLYSAQNQRPALGFERGYFLVRY